MVAEADLTSVAVSLILQEITSRSRKPCVFHDLKPSSLNRVFLGALYFFLVFRNSGCLLSYRKERERDKVHIKTNAPLHNGLAHFHNGLAPFHKGSGFGFGFPITGVPINKSNISHSHKMGYPL